MPLVVVLEAAPLLPLLPLLAPLLLAPLLLLPVADEDPPDDLAVPDDVPLLPLVADESSELASEVAAALEAAAVDAADVIVCEGLGVAASVLPRVTAGSVTTVSVSSGCLLSGYDPHLSSLCAPAAGTRHPERYPARTRRRRMMCKGGRRGTELVSC